MWLAQQAASAGAEKRFGAGSGSVSIGGGSAAVMLDGEKREIATACPGGFFWTPKAGQEVLVLKDDSGGRYILGVLDGGVPDKLAIKAGNAAMYLNSDGVSLEGDIRINGRLYINGTDIEAALKQLGG